VHHDSTAEKEIHLAMAFKLMRNAIENRFGTWLHHR